VGLQQAGLFVTQPIPLARWSRLCSRSALWCTSARSRLSMSRDAAAKIINLGPTAPTQCMDWSVHRLVEHLVGKNLVFAAVLAELPLPQRGDGMPSDQLARAYCESAAVLLDAFGQPGVFDRSYQGPLGAASGAERLKIRMYDLLAHGWDLAQALGRSADLLPEDAAEESLAFARADGRAVRSGGGCFGPARHVADAVPAIVRLVAFLGRDVPAAQPSPAPARR
jgi:uncharacterized protein (TIGR03086 family)